MSLQVTATENTHLGHIQCYMFSIQGRKNGTPFFKRVAPVGKWRGSPFQNILPFFSIRPFSPNFNYSPSCPRAEAAN